VTIVKKYGVFIGVLTLSVGMVLFGCEKKSEAPKPAVESAVTPTAQATTPAPVKPEKPMMQKPAAAKSKKQETKKMTTTKAIIETKFGNITLKFFPETAPGHVKNFIDLAKKGLYDGTTFHRVIPGFMIQGGDPNSKNPDKRTHGTGGPGYTIKAEFSERPHKRGTLSMARSANPDSAGSQFFICVKDAPSLDRQYTVFGEVESGMEAVDKIVSQPRDASDNPNERTEMKVKIVEEK
jgi:peptidyl-prolyl cis-trans isomerase B (cyclophilin B)